MKMTSCSKTSIFRSVYGPTGRPDCPDCSETGRLAYETINRISNFKSFHAVRFIMNSSLKMKRNYRTKCAESAFRSIELSVGPLFAT